MAINDFTIPARLPAAPEKYERVNEQKFRRILELMLRKVQPPGEGDPVDPDEPTILSGLPQRRNVRTTITFGPGIEHAEGEIDLAQDLPEAAGAFALQSEADFDGIWVRIYADAADRAADIALRPTYAEVDLPVTTPMVLDLVFEEPDNMVIRHFDGDVGGVQMFNWDDPALAKLYFAADLPTGAAGVTPDYAQIFGVTAPPPPPELYPALSIAEPFEYPGTGSFPNVSGGRYWWHSNYGGVWCSIASARDIARLTVGAIDHTSIVSRARVYAGPLDSGAWGHVIHYFVKDDGSDWADLNLQIGLIRSGNCAVRPTISWVDDSSVSTILAIGASISIGDGINYGARTPIWYVAKIETIGADVFAEIHTALQADLSDLTLAAGPVLVPTDVQVAGNDRVGFSMFRGTVPEAGLGYGGMVMLELQLGVGDLNPLNVIYDLGVMPVEKPGGTLAEVP